MVKILEKVVLQKIRDHGLLLPDEAQKTIYGDEQESLAIADFFYSPTTIVFADGSPHHLDYVKLGDDTKRKKLRAKGYRVVVIKGEDVEGGIAKLANRIS